MLGKTSTHRAHLAPQKHMLSVKYYLKFAIARNLYGNKAHIDCSFLVPLCGLFFINH